MTNLVSINSGFSLMSAAMTRIGADIVQLHIRLKATSKVTNADFFNPFSVDESITPTHGAPIGSDVASGYIADSCNVWVQANREIASGFVFDLDTSLYAVRK